MIRGSISLLSLILCTLLCGCGRVALRPPSPAASGVPPISAPPSRGGNEGGNGGDTLRPEDGSAWFLTPADEKERKYVSLCYEKAPNFRASDGVIRMAISRAIDNWEVYLEFKGISMSDGKKIWKPTVAFMPSLTENTFSTDPNQISNKCRGDEDLQIVLGGHSQRIENARSHYKNPIAFAHRENFDVSIGWGRGVIGVVEEGHFTSQPLFPAWDEDSLTTIFAHEFGHVLGCDHVSGTIMRADILEFLRKSTSAEGALLNPFKINRERELLLSHGPQLLRPAISVNSESPLYRTFYDQLFGTTLHNSSMDELLFYGHLDTNVDKHAIEVFWGAPLKNIRLFEKVEELSTPTHNEFRITFKEDGLELRYAVQTALLPIRSQSEAKVFRMAIGPSAKAEDGGASEFFSGDLTLAGGKTYPILIQRNSASPLAGLAIWFGDGNKNYPLFYPDSNEELWTNLVE